MAQTSEARLMDLSGVTDNDLIAELVRRMPESDRYGKFHARSWFGVFRSQMASALANGHDTHPVIERHWSAIGAVGQHLSSGTMRMIVSLIERLTNGDYAAHPAMTHWYDNLATAVWMAQRGGPVDGCLDPYVMPRMEQVVN
jgi:hypothetical protein